MNKPTAAQARFLTALADGHAAPQNVVGDWRPINTCTSNGWAVAVPLEGGRCAWEITAEGRVAIGRTEAEPATEAEPRFPQGSPEYAAYSAELQTELDKFAKREAPYDQDELAEPAEVPAYGAFARYLDSRTLAATGASKSEAPTVIDGFQVPDNAADTREWYSYAADRAAMYAEDDDSREARNARRELSAARQAKERLA